MFQEHDFQYALENTRVVVAPKNAIETFGSTMFEFSLVSELLDETGTVRIRRGKVEAERPRIVTPQHLSKLLLEGFGESAREFADFLESSGEIARILRYGFQLRKTDVSEEIRREPLQDVLDRITESLHRENNPLAALIEGVDDAWEVCLLKFAVEMAGRSAGGNVAEWKRRGLV